MFTKSVIAFAGRSVLIGAMFPSLLLASQPHALPFKAAPETRHPMVQRATPSKKGAAALKKKHYSWLSKQSTQHPVSEKNTERSLVAALTRIEHRSNHLQHTRTADVFPLGTFTLRAYTHYHRHAMVTKTATGTLPAPGRTVAVDPKIIPLGTKIYIPGLGERIAEDVGRRVKGKRLDVFLPTTSHCRHFGVQAREVLAIIE